MMKRALSAFAMMSGVALSGCHKDSTSPTQTPTPTPPTYPKVTAADPVGDTIGVPVAGIVQPDLTSISATHDSLDLVVTLTFSSAVTPSNSADAAHAVGGFIDLDTDQNANTGVGGSVGSFTDLFRPDTSNSAGLRIEYVVTLFVDSAGLATVVNEVSGTDVGAITPTFSGSTVTLRIPLALIGHDDGNVNLAAIVGTVTGFVGANGEPEGEPTDLVPNLGHVQLGGTGAMAARTAAASGDPQVQHPARRLWGRRR